jgi:hypothetical protein
MAQVFPRYTNALSRFTAVTAAGLVVTVLWLWGRIQRSPYTSDVSIAKTQPVPFSHAHHVDDLGIDCRYCHTSVENSRYAGVPPTATCMNCHRQIWSEAPMLEPVRESFRSGKSLEWIRVHDLPDFAYFNHQIHVARGVGCKSCHGAIDKMPLTWQTEPLTMGWCLDCHRDPAPHLRPRGEVVSMAWVPPDDQRARGEAIMAAHQIHPPQSCSGCHR